MISINGLAQLVSTIAKKSVKINNVPGPMGVMGRNSHNQLIRDTIGWAPQDNLEYGLEQTYAWIDNMVRNNIVDVKAA
jgi:nucleoside-diphosphate-sugar epimerase